MSSGTVLAMTFTQWPASHVTTVIKRVTPLWMKVLLSISVVVVTVLSYTSYLSYSRGTTWEKRASEAIVSLRAAQDKLVEATEEMGKLESDLVSSERDVKSLELRLTDLANEKAQARDEAAQATLSVAALYDLTQAASSVTSLLSQCIAYQDRWAQVLLNSASGTAYEKSSVESFAKEMATICANALTSAQALKDVVDGL
jgi:hypothetical protein